MLVESADARLRAGGLAAGGVSAAASALLGRLVVESVDAPARKRPRMWDTDLDAIWGAAAPEMARAAHAAVSADTVPPGFVLANAHDAGGSDADEDEEAYGIVARARKRAQDVEDAAFHATPTFRVRVLSRVHREALRTVDVGENGGAHDPSDMRAAQLAVAVVQARWADRGEDTFELVTVADLRPLSEVVFRILTRPPVLSHTDAGAGAGEGTVSSAGEVARIGASRAGASAVVRPAAVPKKYWARRWALWRKFSKPSDDSGGASACACLPGDTGIRMDAPTAWFSVTPEAAATAMAAALGVSGGSVVIDLFCGAGGNTLAFLRAARASGGHVISVERDLARLRDAVHNVRCVHAAEIDARAVTFVHGDALRILSALQTAARGRREQATTAMISDVASALRALSGDIVSEEDACAILSLGAAPIDVLFLAPPWGGPGYAATSRAFDLNSDMRIDGGGAASMDGAQLLEQATVSGVARVVGAFLPRNVKPRSVSAAVRATAFACERMDVMTPWLSRTSSKDAAGKSARGGGEKEESCDGSSSDVGIKCDSGSAAGGPADGAAQPAGPTVILHSISLDRKALGILAVITATNFERNV